MVVVLTTDNGKGSIDGFVKTYDRSYGRIMQEATYGDLSTRGRAPGATYIFGDRWRMNPTVARLCGQMWDALEAGGGAMLNDPRRQLGRFEMVKTFKRAGINSYDAHRIHELEGVRYPVFLRRDDDHSGPLTELIENESDLRTAIRSLLLAGIPAERLMAVEYEGVRSSDGHYRKFSALRIGDAIIAHHIMICTHWTAKRQSRIRTDEAIDESDCYSVGNPHADDLRPIFELAGFDYGRIDYSLANGRIQVWEINDNPLFFHQGLKPHSWIPRHERIHAAFAKLATKAGKPVELDLTGPGLWSVL